MVSPCSTLLAVAFLAAIASAAAAQNIPGDNPPPSFHAPGLGKSQSVNPHVKVNATFDVQQVAPGESFHIAVVFELDPHWHIYWKNAGASGGPTTVKITGPSGFVIGKTLFPRPSTFHGEEGESYGYEDKTVLFVEVTAPPQLSVGQAAFTAKINWMVCKDVCLLGHSLEMLTIVTRSSEAPGANPFAKPIDPAVNEFKSRLPQPLDSLDGASAQFAAGKLTVTLPASGYTAARFFPVEVPGVTYDQPSVKKENDRIIITVPVKVNPNDSLGEPMTVGGTVGLGDRSTDPCYDFEIPLPAS